MLTHTLEKLRFAWPFGNGSNFPILVAVSGGPDSVSLLRLLLAMPLDETENRSRLIVGHVNHGLRGDRSNADEQFVSDLAVRLGLEFLCVKQSPTKKRAQLPSSEEDLRDFRYAELLKMARQTGARYIATGHTLDDQVETILFRVFRGTGIAGLAGIPAVRVVDESISIIRPLLGISRVEIDCVLKEWRQDYCVDETNSEENFTRNFLRLQIIPKIRTRFGDSISESIIRLSKQAAEAEAYLDEQTDKLWSAIRTCTSQQVEIDLRGFNNHAPVLLRQFFKQIWRHQKWPLQSMTFDWWQSLAAAAGQITTVQQVLNLPGGVRVEMVNGRMWIFAEIVGVVRPEL